MSSAYLITVVADINDDYHTDDYAVGIALTKDAAIKACDVQLAELQKEHAAQNVRYETASPFLEDVRYDEYILAPSTLYAVVRQEKHTSDSGNWDSVPSFRAIAHVECVFHKEEEAVAYVRANEFNWGNTVDPVKEFGFPHHYNNDVEVERFITPITL